MAFNVVLFKWISAAVIWITTFIGNALPLYITAIKWTSRLESLAGGIFLGAGLAHLLNDAIDTLSSKSAYPWAPAIALITFVVLTAVDLFSYSEHDKQFNVEEDERCNEELKVRKDSNSLDNAELSEKVTVFGQSNSQMTIPTYSLYFIMDIHSIIGGLALGITESKAGVIAIFCAIVGHKPVEAFALSLIILKDKPTKVLFWILASLYTVMTPIGIIIGIYLLKSIDSESVIGSIGAISAGTFLYVGTHEWSEIPEHKEEWTLSEKLWHFGMFTIGIIWMLLIPIIEMYGE